jgi:glutamine amidotransferase
MAVVVIDYGAGNLRSVANALAAAGAPSVRVSDSAAEIATAERIVLPGVGAFGACAAQLRAVPGLVDGLETAVRVQRVPFLGVCVGMQLMATAGEEFGLHRGLGWIAGTVRRIAPPGLKVPHIGWNEVGPASGTLLAPGHAYFVHSYALAPEDTGDIAATVDYGGALVAAVQRETMLGVQFHPEKSQRYGLDLLARWLAWRP